jgi:hypothetical protein
MKVQTPDVVAGPLCSIDRFNSSTMHNQMFLKSAGTHPLPGCFYIQMNLSIELLFGAFRGVQ